LTFRTPLWPFGITGGKFDLAKLPCHLFACVSGRRPNPRAVNPTTPARTGSRRWTATATYPAASITGLAEVFDKLDTDKNGLLDTEEATRATVRK
jgi:hypothetical protein